ncbi:MAG: hypothetical protein JJU41_05945 [Bacteroidetes bacterium]|nr:hypothetical protein [Bacteroidota bacterium]
MSSDHLTHNKFEILSAFIDGELDDDEKAIAENLISSQPECRYYVKSMALQKNKLKEACGRVKAPSGLRERCLVAINGDAMPVSKDKPQRKDRYSTIWWIAAAAILVVSLIGILRQETIPNDGRFELSSYEVEEYVYRHFNSGTPELLTSYSTTEAEGYILEAWDIDMTVPELSGASFTGFSYAEFVPDYHTPVLVYHTDDTLEPIVIFAFDVAAMHGDISLIRNQEAVETCVHPDSVHIKDIDGKHIVSWMWDGTWYAGASDHHGEVFASRLPINR